jgi:hypothetical protein
MASVFATPMDFLPADEAINGFYPSTSAPAVAFPAPEGEVSMPMGINAQPTLIWWVVLFLLLVFGHILTLRLQE